MKCIHLICKFEIKVVFIRVCSFFPEFSGKTSFYIKSISSPLNIATVSNKTSAINIGQIPTTRCVSNVLFIYLFIMYSRGLYIVRDGIRNTRLNVPLCIVCSRDRDGFLQSQKITSFYQRIWKLWFLIQEIEFQGNKKSFASLIL